MKRITELLQALVLPSTRFAYYVGVENEDYFRIFPVPAKSLGDQFHLTALY